MKKNPPTTHPNQREFLFATQPEIHWAPSVAERVLCCSIPEQRPHKSGSCYADRLPSWLRPPHSVRQKIYPDGGKPPARPQKPKSSHVTGSSQVNQKGNNEQSNSTIPQKV